MRRILMLLAMTLAFCAGPALAQEAIPNLEGTWHVATSEFHVKGKDFLGSGTSAVWKFDKQQGRIIHGSVEWDVKGKSHKGKDRFSGVIAKDNKTIYIAGHGEGVRIGHLEGADAITMYFIVPGGAEPRAGFAELKRAK
ncbi:MAG: hypothetical protein V1797_14600 [Pseudomonadota bacterium]